MAPSPSYDLIVFGATSFVGQILTRYLFERHGADEGLRWALAGRSEAKLAQVRATLGAGAESLPLIVADAQDAAAMTDLCQQTRVVVSTVGPYALYGNALVAACAQTGTDYCDLTGEVQWIHRMIAEHEAVAKKSGARIVHCCGFDSIPSDLGVHFLQAASRERFGAPAERVKLRIKAMRGAASGGTVASLMNVMKEVAADPTLRKLMGNPYAIAPSDVARPKRQPNVQLGEFDAEVKTWLAPFVMAAINTRIVHRSNLLTDFAYGANFVYDEAMMSGAGLKGQFTANAIALGLGAFVGLAALRPSRALLERFVVPKPGEGPSPEAQQKGFFDFRFYGRTAAGDTLITKVTGDRDPGYGSTGKMLGEAAVCLALDLDKAKVGGGFWTPATGMGDALIERLVAHAGLTFEVL
ncbi:saccharopine dehydrogenase family protein [Polycyclovorans algicola]|uniref:saccharopine dehydrogenase family protein n=1 Tax=Polycyclovorans algicola TaxID=616992 RepID=UPI0004A6B593|nr:saccharopine dehydrogenase NADP-binding domain-containing protein [Polycyclovorans algicola]